MCSSTRTSSVTYGLITFGTTRSALSPTICPISSVLFASSLKSSSARRCCSTSSARAESWSSCARWERRSTKAVVERRSSRSTFACSRTPGRRTLTTTSRPSWRRALWICAIEAAASGSGSIRTKTSGSTFRRLDLGERNRRHLVDEPRELLDVHVGHQVGARGEELPELDVRRPELLERESKLARTFGGRRPLSGEADLPQHAQQPLAPRGAEHLKSAAQPFTSSPHAGILPVFPPSKSSDLLGDTPAPPGTRFPLSRVSPGSFWRFPRIGAPRSASTISLELPRRRQLPVSRGP